MPKGKDLKLLSGLDYDWVALFVLVRTALIIWMIVLVVQDILHPDRDVVRQVGQDDPSGGEFDGAPDRRVIRGFTRSRVLAVPGAAASPPAPTEPEGDPTVSPTPPNAPPSG